MRKVAVFVGTRPEAIKLAPVIRALQQAEDLEPVVVSTGQHKQMLQQVIDLFGIGVDHELAVMQPNQTLAGLTARLIERVDALLGEVEPDLAVVQGDTTTVLAASLACFYRRIPIGHVEAGLRTGNIWSPFPEEANRKLASSLVSLHFAPTERGRENLLNEGVDEQAIRVTGNTVIDALQIEAEQQKASSIKAELDRALGAELGAHWDQVPFVLVTGHRRENFGQGFAHICEALGELAERFPEHRFVYPVHLNPNVQGPVYEALGDRPNIRLIEPKDYRSFVALMNHCRVVLTDSGGVQEEAPGLGKPVLVMRETTERPEGVDAGTVKLVGTDRQRIVTELSRLLSDEQAYRRMAEAVNPYGDGQASGRIVERIRTYLAAEDAEAAAGAGSR